MPIELDMSVEETIEHLEQIAKNQFDCADRIDELHCDSTSTRNMASYHKQLAEWLRELKAYREQIQNLINNESFEVVNPFNTYKYIRVVRVADLYDLIEVNADERRME